MVNINKQADIFYIIERQTDRENLMFILKNRQDDTSMTYMNSLVQTSTDTVLDGGCMVWCQSQALYFVTYH